MTKTVLDTSVLLDFWHRRVGNAWEEMALDAARAIAEPLIRVEQTRAIVTPVRLEVLCGGRTAHEVALFDAYLSAFDVVDRGDVLRQDWELAEQLARRIPRNWRLHGKRRQLGDCLIRAIAKRLRYDVRSHDKGFPG
jgi:predicted nucleic acid-binding protein